MSALREFCLKYLLRKEEDEMAVVYAIPDTLCQCVFALLGGECGVMGWIKTTKDKQQDRKWAEEDRQRMEREAQQPAQDFEPSFTAEQKNRDQ